MLIFFFSFLSHLIRQMNEKSLFNDMITINFSFYLLPTNQAIPHTTQKAALNPAIQIVMMFILLDT